MESIADIAAPGAALAIPRFEDGFVNMQELLRTLAESVVNEIMAAEAEQLCGDTGGVGNGYRERRLATCVGTLTLRIPKLRSGTFFPEDVLERYRRVDRAVVAAVAEMYATGTSTGKVQGVARAMGIGRLSKDQASAICEHLDSEVEELSARPLGDLAMPYVWIDAAYVECRRERRVASTAVVTAIGCDSDGWRHVLGIGVVDTESYDSWLAFLRTVRSRGVDGVRLAASDAHAGLRRAIGGVFQGAAWQRCAVHLMRDCIRAAGSRKAARRVARIVAPVFRLREAGAVRAAYHIAVGMLSSCCPEAAGILEEAEPDALACLDLPPSHWKRIRTNNLQERTNRELKRRSRVVQVFPSTASLMRLAGAVMCDRDESWADARCFSQARMAELYEEGAPAPEPTPEQAAGWQLVARRAIESSLELAEKLEAA
ncbi:IS256 family transposase [Coriobacteriales bacterium OH1046]|nr:IS256 family transposase [Coriobacteriales bacterium OH1046]